ncbi:MAG: prkC 31 [Acidobacteria bacterium]|nr:prkC 31 [Acidobacteriota bacterium]
MGEVYRARDARLNRDVAIKVLPESFAADPERLGRFQREAQVLASLNHPHIAHLHGLEESKGVRALVMELVEGEDLAQRIARGPIPLDEALPIARQIAEALEAAHEQGIIHRDLKPANIKVRPDGTVKVLDFGLAKAMDPPGSPAANAMNSPTLSMHATQAGIILGTAAYMSPEQARGRAVDTRADIWAFGAVLFEMLTGRRAFPGDDATDTIVAVVSQEPDWSALPRAVSADLRRLLTRCLIKDPRTRLRDIGEARIALDPGATPPDATTETASADVRHRPFWERAAAIAGAMALAAVVAALATRSMQRPPSAAVVRFSLPAENLRANTYALAISPDGARIVYSILGMNGPVDAGLAVRNLAEPEMRLIPSTSSLGTLVAPTFSPDGQFIAFWAAQDATLKKVPVGGGPAVTVAKASVPSGMAWTGDDIVFGQPAGVMRVSSGGGEPQLLVKVDPGTFVANPQIIDRRGSILFSLSDELAIGRWDRAQVVVQSPDGVRHVVVQGGSAARLLPSGHLLYMVGSTLFAIRFDAVTLRTVGSATPVVEGVARARFNGGPQAGVGQYAISDGGTLAYAQAPLLDFNGARRLALVDRDGKTQVLPPPSDAYAYPRISPNGRSIVMSTDDGKQAAIWVYDLGGAGPPRRLTFAGRNVAPIWSADGKSVTYQSTRDGDHGLFEQRVDGTGAAERLTKTDGATEQFPDSWSADGKTLSFRLQSGAHNAIWTISRDGSRTPRPLLELPDREQVASAFSPDGRWIAYGSNELIAGGSYQVFVQPFPPTGAKYQVTPQISSTPVWARGGKRLFYAYTNRVFSTDVDASTGFAVAGQPFEYKTQSSLGSLPGVRHFDVMPSGDQVLVVIPEGAGADAGAEKRQFEVVLNWFEELKAKVPAT